MGARKILRGITWPFRRLDRAVERDLAEKTQVVVVAGLEAFAEFSPVAVELLAGRPVRLEFRAFRRTFAIQIRLAPGGES